MKIRLVTVMQDDEVSKEDQIGCKWSRRDQVDVADSHNAIWWVPIGCPEAGVVKTIYYVYRQDLFRLYWFQYGLINKYHKSYRDSYTNQMLCRWSSYIETTLLIKWVQVKWSYQDSYTDVRSWGVSLVLCRIGIAIPIIEFVLHISIIDKAKVMFLNNIDRVIYLDMSILE